VRKIDADTPARFNADPSRLYEASGSAGKICIFAVRLDTFLIINKLGTQYIPRFFRYKNTLDGWLARFGAEDLSDKLLQFFANLLPRHLPAKLYEYRDLYEHHLLLRISNDTHEQIFTFLRSYFSDNLDGSFFECDAEEGRKDFLHRFAVAGAAIRYRAMYKDTVEDIFVLDIALRRNERNWVEQLPPELEHDFIHKLYYGHFICHVFHQDYLVKKGANSLEAEHKMWALLDARGVEYPAEHNVGHLYVAKPNLAKFYQVLDPTNSFNPGIGHTARYKNWICECHNH